MDHYQVSYILKDSLGVLEGFLEAKEGFQRAREVFQGAKEAFLEDKETFLALDLVDKIFQTLVEEWVNLGRWYVLSIKAGIKYLKS